MSTPQENPYEKFHYLAAGNVSDAMDELGLPRSIIVGIPCVGVLEHAVIGNALTIEQARRSASSAGGNLTLHGKVIDEQAGPNDIVVIDTNGVLDVSTGGAIQMMIAKSRGACGYLTNGALRDIGEIRTLDFPAFAVASSPAKSSLDLETVGVNVPVMIGGVQIKPKDVIFMDDTGIVVIPKERALEVLDKAASVYDREERLVRYLKQGVSLSEARILVKKEV